MAYVGETFRIHYVAKDRKVGLTDVRLTVYKPNGSAQGIYSLAPLNGSGIYYFDYSDSDIEGNYLFVINSLSNPLWDARQVFFENRVWTVAEKNQIIQDMSFMKNIEGGKWELVSPNFLIYYKSDNVTEIARFKCFDLDGNPTMENIMRVERFS